MNKAFYIIFLVIILVNNSYNILAQDRKFIKTISTKNPHNTCITLTNNSDTMNEFSFTFNNKFYSSFNDIKNEILALANQKEDSLFYYAWKFVCNNTYNNKSIVRDNWSTTISIYINSLGVGLCGKQAIVLSKIWSKLGYETRIWGLEGHIVPEVFINNKWTMLDPAFRVYFLNEKSEIAGIKELEENPTLITKPKKMVKNDVYYFMRYSKYYENLVSSTQNNRLIYSETIPEEISEFKLNLPPHSVFEFPGNFYNVKSFENNPVPFYATCRIKIPPCWSGTLKNSLILCDIKGTGKIDVNGTEYVTDDFLLHKTISEHKSFIKDITISENTDTIELIYLINPILTDVKKENTVTINGKKTEDILINSNYLQDSLSIFKLLEKQYFFYEKQRIDILTNSLTANIDTNNNINNISSKEEFYFTFSNYLNNVLHINSSESDSIIQKVENAFNKLPTDYKYDNFYSAVNNIPRFLIFEDLKNAPQSRIQNVLINLTKKE